MELSYPIRIHDCCFFLADTYQYIFLSTLLLNLHMHFFNNYCRMIFAFFGRVSITSQRMGYADCLLKKDTHSLQMLVSFLVTDAVSGLIVISAEIYQAVFH